MDIKKAIEIKNIKRNLLISSICAILLSLMNGNFENYIDYFIVGIISIMVYDTLS